MSRSVDITRCGGLQGYDTEVALGDLSNDEGTRAVVAEARRCGEIDILGKAACANEYRS
jgi:hypothetical protein